MVTERICLRLQETWVQSLGWEDPLEKAIETCLSILAWEIPLGQKRMMGCSPWGHRVRHD